MQRTVVTFFPHNPMPPQSGAHRRFLEVLGALRALGCRTTLVGSRLLASPSWRPESVRRLENDLVAAVRLHQPGPVDYAVAGPLYLCQSLTGRPAAVNSRAHAPPGLCRFFARVLDDAAPDVVLINYACWDRLLDHGRRSGLRVLDTYDLWSLNVAMREALRRHLPRPPARLDDVPDRVLDVRFFDAAELVADDEEFRIFDRYDYTLAITVAEADLIRRRAPRTRVVCAPMTLAVREVANSYDGPALFAVGPNPFNLQGYCYFARKVLPILRGRAPSFALTLTGAAAGQYPRAAGVTWAGLVPDLAPTYAAARFAVCPVFGGTGQPVKVVEAMAHGVPVVALRAPAERSPLRHGVNGFVADDAEQFAAHCAALWNDRELCASLGQAARKTIAAECAPARLRALLADVLVTCRKESV